MKSSQTVFSQITALHALQYKTRQELLARAQVMQSAGKRAIFAIHREDHKGANELLQTIQTQLKACDELIKKVPALVHEGAYRAALEEYAEALLFLGFVTTGVFQKIDRHAMDPATYIGGLCDATGEMVRYAMRQVTLNHEEMVKQVTSEVASVIEFLLHLDLTGALRTKADQAKRNFARLEEMSYELALRS